MLILGYFQDIVPWVYLNARQIYIFIAVWQTIYLKTSLISLIFLYFNTGNGLKVEIITVFFPHVQSLFNKIAKSGYLIGVSALIIHIKY